MKCPKCKECKGKKWVWFEEISPSENGLVSRKIKIDCPHCNGTGIEPGNDTCLQETGKFAEYFEEQEKKMPDKVKLKSAGSYAKRFMDGGTENPLCEIFQECQDDTRAYQRAEDAETCRKMQKSNKYYASVEKDRDLELNYDGRAWILGLAAKAIEEGD